MILPPYCKFCCLAFRKDDHDQCDDDDEPTAPGGRGFSAKSSSSATKPHKWAFLDGLWLILSSTYLLYVSLFLWLNAVVSSFFYFQVRVHYFYCGEMQLIFLFIHIFTLWNYFLLKLFMKSLLLLSNFNLGNEVSTYLHFFQYQDQLLILYSYH